MIKTVIGTYDYPTYEIKSINGSIRNNVIGYYSVNSTLPGDTLIMTNCNKEGKIYIYCSRQNDLWNDINITINTQKQPIELVS